MSRLVLLVISLRFASLFAPVVALQQIQPPQKTSSSSPPLPQMSQPTQAAVAFSHVHLYVDRLEDLSVYKDLENKLNQFSSQVNPSLPLDEKRKVWQSIAREDNDSTQIVEYVPQNRDVVKSL